MYQWEEIHPTNYINHTIRVAKRYDKGVGEGMQCLKLNWVWLDVCCGFVSGTVPKQSVRLWEDMIGTTNEVQNKKQLPGKGHWVGTGYAEDNHKTLQVKWRCQSFIRHGKLVAITGTTNKICYHFVQLVLLIWRSGCVFCLLLRVSSDYAQPITGQVTEVTCPVMVRAQSELTPRKRQKTGPGVHRWKLQVPNLHMIYITSNGSWCMGIKGEMSGLVCVTFTWDMYIYMSCL